MTTPFSFRCTQIAVAIGSLSLVLTAGQAFGAGFILQENSGSGLGNAYAGGAAASEDADTVWTNPAGMARLKTNQFAAAVNFITPSSKFSDNGGSLPAAQQPLGGNGGDAGGTSVVPNLYLVTPINKQWAFGVGINAPFGLKTEYDNSWLGRYQAIESKIQTINVNPALSYTWGSFSIGAGANWQQAKLTFTNAINYSGGLGQVAAAGVLAGKFPPAALAPFLAATKGIDANVNTQLTDSAWGWNIGAEWNIGGADSRSRIGAQYRSAITYNADGTPNISIPPSPTLPPPLDSIYAGTSAVVNAGLAANSVPVHTNVKVPPTANLSFFHTMLNDKWDFMGDVQWTGWSTIQDLTLTRDSGTTASVLPLKFKDAWRVSVGANYRYTDQWMFRSGLAWDQTPVQNQYRTPRLPDTDRIWVAGGLRYRPMPALALDLGVAYLFMQDGSIYQSGNPPDVPTNGLIDGNYKNNVWIVSGQITYSF
jgi:long-chain fatty acid transport protein